MKPQAIFCHYHAVVWSPDVMSKGGSKCEVLQGNYILTGQLVTDKLLGNGHTLIS